MDVLLTAVFLLLVVVFVHKFMSGLKRDRNSKDLRSVPLSTDAGEYEVDMVQITQDGIYIGRLNRDDPDGNYIERCFIPFTECPCMAVSDKKLVTIKVIDGNKLVTIK
jgi:hypothetical protein